MSWLATCVVDSSLFPLHISLNCAIKRTQVELAIRPSITVDLLYTGLVLPFTKPCPTAVKFLVIYGIWKICSKDVPELKSFDVTDTAMYCLQLFWKRNLQLNHLYFTITVVTG